MTIDKKIVLLGAGSASFGPPSLQDIYSSEVLTGSTIMLCDIDKEKLERVYDIVVKENEIAGSKYNIDKTTDWKKALKNADFVICSIENGDRFELRWQDNTIPHELGSTEMMAENGGPGGFFHSARQIPQIVQIAKELYRENPHAYFINYSNPMSRICLAVKRAVPDLKLIGLCHQIHLLLQDLPYIIDDELKKDKLKDISLNEKYDLYKKSLERTKIITGGLNHFAFILGLENRLTGEDLMPKFNNRLMKYYEGNWDRFKYADLTFEVYKRYGWFPYVGDNHLAEYVIFGSEFTKYNDFRDWIKRMEDGKIGINKRLQRYHRRLKKGRYPKKGYLIEGESDERGIPIIEELISGNKAYEVAVNIPNDGIIENLPRDLIIECSAELNEGRIEGIRLGKIPKNIASLLRVEATTQDICVEAILNESKELAINCIATDVNCGSFEVAEKIFDRLYKIQRKYLPNFK
jgi:alpha-galactosidase